jgi:NAD(P)-dependent dehydrogenase (short-subunit alcohol dehydrogenase family)
MAERIQKKINSGFPPKSEPSEILAGIDLTGKVAVVTGGYSGIGLETTRALAGAGARVYVPVRDPAKAQSNLEDVDGTVITEQLDLGNLDSVRTLVEKLLTAEKAIDLLINNAGIMACPETRLGNNWESQFAVNHIGHFVLSNGLLPAILAADAPRVVCLSSIGHRRSDILWDDIHFHSRPYEKWTAYAQSKTANALFALGLDMKYRDEEMHALGWTDADGNLSELAAALFKTPSQGCTTTLWAATSPQLAGMGGLYCEDCDVADLATEESERYFGVAPWAVSEDSALRLWELTEEMLA